MHATTASNKQSGAALVVSLLILLVMTLIGVSSMQTTTMEEKMSNNTRERQQAFEAAEAALRGAEEFIASTVSVTADFDTTGSDGLYDGSVQELWKTISWTAGTNCAQYDYASADYSSSSFVKPCYVIEHYGTATTVTDQYNLGSYGSGAGGGDVELFRITVRGTGANAKSPVYLQSAYGKIL